MSPIRYLYASLRLSLTRMAIVTLLERHDKGLEALGEDLLQILNETNMENIHKGSALFDYFSMNEMELDYTFDRPQIEEELTWLIEEIKFIQEKYRKEIKSKPRAIFFEFPNTIVFELPETVSVLQHVIHSRKRLCRPI